MFRNERKIAQEYLTEMKKRFFPKLLVNLKTILNNLEMGEGTELMFYGKALDEGLSKTLLWQFGSRFLKLNDRLKDLRENLGVYEEKLVSFSRGEDDGRLKNELSSMNLTLKGEIADLINEIEPLMKLEKLPPRRRTGFGL